MPETVKQGEIASPEKERTTFAAFVKSHIFDLTAYAGLIVMLVLFIIFNKGPRLLYNFSSVIQAAAVYSILSLGAVFIYSMGYMDISLGAQIGVYCLLLILITNASGSLVLGFCSILAIAIVCGLINGFVSVKLGLPSIVTSIFLNAVFGGAQMLIMEKLGTNSISMNTKLKFFKQMPVMLTAIILIAVIAVFLYQFTQLGKLTKGIGANETATSISGVNTTKWKVLAYVFFGFCIAVGALFLTARTNSAGKGTGAGYAMDIMVSLLLGGMPLSGGMRSKISAALVGAFTYVILANGLILSGVSTTLIYIIKAMVFMAVILMTCRKPNGVLPR